MLGCPVTHTREVGKMREVDRQTLQVIAILGGIWLVLALWMGWIG